MVIPFEFSFTKVISSEGIFGDIFGVFYLIKIGDSQISIMEILFAIWITVFLVLTVRFAYQYHKAMKEVFSYDKCEDNQCKKVFEKVLNVSKKKMKIDIRHNENIEIPMGIGVLRKSIILPGEDYSDSESLLSINIIYHPCIFYNTAILSSCQHFVFFLCIFS